MIHGKEKSKQGKISGEYQAPEKREQCGKRDKEESKVSSCTARSGPAVTVKLGQTFPREGYQG